MKDKQPDGSPEEENSAESSQKRSRAPLFSMELYRSVVEEQIRDAQERGEFDNLPGAGKPLNIDKNEYAGENELAYKILKDNDMTLPWIADRNALLLAIEGFRREVAHQWQVQGLPMLAVARAGRRDIAQHRWRHVVASLEASLAKLNKRIEDVNLSVPVRNLEMARLQLDDELARAGAVREM